MIAIISFKELVTEAVSNVGTSKLRRDLLSTATLVFKGGAAMGKFLFLGDEQRWESLSDEDKQCVKEMFINGGDNDTSVSFHEQPSAERSEEDMNQEIGSILYDLEGIVLRNVGVFHIDEIIEEYIDLTADGVMEFAGKQFSFERSSRSSFMIVDKDATHLELLPFTDVHRPLFGSISYIEFDNIQGKKVKFFLARIKAGFCAVMDCANDPLRFNCYAECLDISACCIDSADPFDAVYTAVSFSCFL
jgi:hypothetical protein